MILCCVFVCIASSSYQWYSWGPPNMQCRLCASCWTYWKKYGGLKMPTRLDGERPGPNRNNMVQAHTRFTRYWLCFLSTNNSLTVCRKPCSSPKVHLPEKNLMSLYKMKMTSETLESVWYYCLGENGPNDALLKQTFCLMTVGKAKVELITAQFH